MRRVLHFICAFTIATLTLFGCKTTDRTAYHTPYNRSHKPPEIPYDTSYQRPTQPQFIEDISMDNKHSAVAGNSKRNNKTHYPGQKHKKIKVPSDPPLEPPTPAPVPIAKTKQEPLPVHVPGTTGSLEEKYANILGVAENEITNPILYQFIDEWYGVRYRMGGNDKNGIDCSAFAKRLYEEVYATNVLRTAIDQFSNCNFIRKTNQMKEGDLVFFGIHSKHITHVGVYLMNGYFVHSSSSQGVVISNINDDYWQSHFKGGGRIPKNNGSF